MQKKSIATRMTDNDREWQRERERELENEKKKIRKRQRKKIEYKLEYAEVNILEFGSFCHLGLESRYSNKLGTKN